MLKRLLHLKKHTSLGHIPSSENTSHQTPRKTADTQSKKSFPTLLYEHEKINFCSAIFPAVAR